MIVMRQFGIDNLVYWLYISPCSSKKIRGTQRLFPVKCMCDMERIYMSGKAKNFQMTF